MQPDPMSPFMRAAQVNSRSNSMGNDEQNDAQENAPPLTPSEVAQIKDALCQAVAAGNLHPPTSVQALATELVAGFRLLNQQGRQ